VFLGISFLGVILFNQNIIQIFQINKLNLLQGANPFLLITPEFLIISILTISVAFWFYKKLDWPLVGYGRKFLFISFLTIVLIFSALTTFLNNRLTEQDFLHEIKEAVYKIPFFSDHEKDKLINDWESESKFYGIVSKKQGQELTLKFRDTIELFADPNNLTKNIPIGEFIEVEYEQKGNDKVLLKIEVENDY